MPRARAFVVPSTATVSRRPLSDQHASLQLRMSEKDSSTNSRRDFLLQTIVSTGSIMSFIPSVAQAEEDDYLYKRDDGGDKGDMVSKLFNPDGSLKDPNTVVEAQEKAISLPFSVTSAPSSGFDVAIATDGVPPTSSGGSAATNLQASYKLPLKWTLEATSQFPQYYDASEGKNGKSCNRITVYSISQNNLDMKVLEKASTVGVAKSLFMDQLPNNYYDRGVTRADLISGRTVRKPIKDDEGGIDEQVYYEFDIAFAPLECPDYMEGNKENLGLGFCPYDRIFLISATVLQGNLMCCVVECDKVEWKMANSDLKRVRSSFVVDR